MTVNRWHSNPWPALRNSGDTIDAHQWRVWRLLMQINPGASIELQHYALTHDEAERTLGDMPSPAKDKFPELAAMYEQAEAGERVRMGHNARPDGWELVRLCDMADAFRWADLHEPRALWGEDFQDLEVAIHTAFEALCPGLILVPHLNGWKIKKRPPRKPWWSLRL